MSPADPNIACSTERSSLSDAPGSRWSNLAARISVDQGQGSAGLLNWYGAPVTLTSCHASPHGRMNRLRPYFASHPCASTASLSLHNGDGRVKMPDADASVPRARRWCRHWGNIHDRSLATNPARDACDTDCHHAPGARDLHRAQDLRAGPPKTLRIEAHGSQEARKFRAPAGASRHDPGEGVLREATIARECHPPFDPGRRTRAIPCDRSTSAGLPP